MVFFILFALFCSNNIGDSTTNLHSLSSKKLENIGTYVLPLDSETGFNADCVTTFEDNAGNLIIALGYGNQRKIILYDYKSSQPLKTVLLEADGANGVGNEIRGFVFGSPDSLYIFSYWEREICLTNDAGEVVQRFKIPDSTLYPIIEPETMCPLTKVDDFIYLSGVLPLHSRNISPIVKLNIKTGDLIPIGQCTAKVYSGNFLRLNQVKYDYLPSVSQFVVSFNISDSLYFFDAEGLEVKQAYTKSEHLSVIEPFSYDITFVPAKEERHAYDIGDQYWGIKYDKYRNVYYRFAIFKRTMNELYSGKMPRFIVMVFDSDFNKLDELVLPENAQIEMSFIAEDGLYIGNSSYYSASGSELTFDIFRME